MLKKKKKKRVNFKTPVCRVPNLSALGTLGTWHSLYEQKFILKYFNLKREGIRTYMPCLQLIFKRTPPTQLLPDLWPFTAPDPPTTSTPLFVQSCPRHCSLRLTVGWGSIWKAYLGARQWWPPCLLWAIFLFWFQDGDQHREQYSHVPVWEYKVAVLPGPGQTKEEG